MIIYTKTDEAPALATQSLLPIVRLFCDAARIEVAVRDISLAGRIIASFPENLEPDQRLEDDLAWLGQLAKTPEANIIKLPNISASVPQLQAAIAELQAQGYAVPDYPEEPTTPEQRDVAARYSKVLGSAVNPVLREGNSDRRVAAPVKQYARNNPHSMGEWSSDSRSHVSHMQGNDFYANEQSVIVPAAGVLKIEHIGTDGVARVLKDGIAVQAGEVIASTFMSCRALRDFFDEEILAAKRAEVLLSLHVKATMMKVSDPIIFGHAVKAYYAEVFDKYADVFDELGVEPNNGIGDVYARIAGLPDAQRAEIESAIEAVYADRPALAMVDSDKGITNLHVPSNVIIDASMPAAIRASGKMWGPDGKLADMNAMIPDRCYAGMYEEVIEDCKRNGAFDVRTMGNVSNVGLMAQKAEEYGSHDKTFEIKTDGVVRVVDESGKVLTEHEVQAGDIWRMGQTRDLPIRDWVKLGVERARSTGSTAIFWLDEARAYDRNLIALVRRYLGDHDTNGLDIRVAAPIVAMRETLQRVREGKDTISVTGNVLRDYLTDLFPILELGTSAKMLSIVPLLAGGGLYETGAGGSAPKHVQQFLAENHLRWDSLGEFLALAVSIEDHARKDGNAAGLLVSAALDAANGNVLNNNKSPLRKVGELDNRGSHFYLALYWAQALAAQREDAALRARFAALADQLASSEQTIISELAAVQGAAVDIGGYYHPGDALAAAAMRPSKTFNAILQSAS